MERWTVFWNGSVEKSQGSDKGWLADEGVRQYMMSHKGGFGRCDPQPNSPLAPAQTDRRTQRYSRWLKITIIWETNTYLIGGLLVTRGPNNEARHFEQIVPPAHRLIGFETLVADAAYDAEANHALGGGLGIETVIPVNRRRSRGVVDGRYRQQMATGFPAQTYHRRSHVESVFSQDKRLLGSALRARQEASRSREYSLRVLTHNLMLLLLCQFDFSTKPIRPLFNGLSGEVVTLKRTNEKCKTQDRAT